MSVNLICKPGKVVTWEQLKHYQHRTIAVDGYCSGGPRSTPDGLIVNINHHEDVDPVATRASCGQALCLVNLGLYDVFMKRGERDVNIYVNDCDQDVVWATYILMHPKHVSRPKLKTLVQFEDHLDMSAGLWPMDSDSRENILPELCWICEPFTEVVSSGKFSDLDGDKMRKLIVQMHRRINKCLFGRGGKVNPDTRFEVLAQFPLWSFVKETGAHARYGMSEKGVFAYCTLRTESEGVYRYSLGRLSHIIPFPMHLFYEDLNKTEGIAEDDPDRWSGGVNSGGSPRKRGSRLNVLQVSEILNHRLKKTREARRALLDKGINNS